MSGVSPVRLACSSGVTPYLLGVLTAAPAASSARVISRSEW